MTKCINNKCNKLKQSKYIVCISLYSYHESTLIIFYNNDMLWCTNNTHIIMSALLSASPTLQKCTTRKKAQDSQCSTVVFAINDSLRSCKLMIPCRLNVYRLCKNNVYCVS